MSLIEAIDQCLPQTQCAQCGHPGCRPYAEAIARGEADINQCPPGGQAGVDALAALLDRDSKPLDPAHGSYTPPQVAWIDEAVCIGCTKCIQACPVDAIVGARKLMHTVIADECTGCDLCLEPCPVDCIHMLPTDREAEPDALRQARRDTARQRFEHRNARLAARQAEANQRRQARREARQQTPSTPSTATTDGLPDRATRRATAQAALERARARRTRQRSGQP